MFDAFPKVRKANTQVKHIPGLSLKHFIPAEGNIYNESSHCKMFLLKHAMDWCVRRAFDLLLQPCEGDSSDVCSIDED